MNYFRSRHIFQGPTPAGRTPMEVDTFWTEKKAKAKDIQATEKARQVRAKV